MSMLRESFLQRCDAFFVLLHCSHSDPQPFRQVIALQWANDDFHGQQSFKYRRTVAHIDENKIARARTKFQFHRAEFLLQISAARIHYAFALAQMFVVCDSGQRTTLSDAIHIEWLSRFLEHLNQLRWRHSIAYAQAG